MNTDDVPEIGFYTWFSSEPPILFHSESCGQDVGGFLPLERIYRLVCYCWHKPVEDIVRYHALWNELRPAHRLLHLINDQSTFHELQSRGVPAVFVNHNAFLDETIFIPQPGVPRSFDVVYNARMCPLKRHTLLCEMKSALLIGGLLAPTDTQEYFDHVRAVLPQATFTHATDARHRSPQEIAQLLNSARVGVCLSEVEGAMFSATEYLLCGLPVVSTPSLGGRDTWFDPRFTRIVPPEPHAIAEAAQELIALQLSPACIRNETVQRMLEHRQRFTTAVQKIHTSEGTGRDFAREFYSTFQNKCGTWRPNRDVTQYRDP